jgi:hypothetical protein
VLLNSVLLSFELGNTVDGETAGALWVHETGWASAGADWNNLHWSLAEGIS